MDIEIKDAKDAIEKAQEAASKTQEYINEAQKIMNSNGTISELQSFMLKLDGIGNVSTALGIIGAGLELAIMLSGEPSPMEQMMKMLSNISDQIERLETRMEYQFDRLKTYVYYTTLKSKMADASSVMNNNIGLMRLYAQIKKDPNASDYNARLMDCETRLKSIDRSKDVLLQAQIFSDLVTGHSGLEKILDVCINYSYGDLRNVMTIGDTLLNYTLIALSLDGLLSGLYYRDLKFDNDKIATAASKNAQEMYSPLIANIQNALSQAINTVTQEEKCNNWAKNYCEKELFPTLTVDNFDATAKILGKELGSQWFWYDWVVVVYSPVSGSDLHSVAGYFATYFRQKVNNGSLNVVIGRINKEHSNHLGALKDFAKEARKLKNTDYTIGFRIEETINGFIAKKTLLKIEEGMLWLYDSQSTNNTYGFFNSSLFKPRVWNAFEMQFTQTPEFCNVVLHA